MSTDPTPASPVSRKTIIIAIIVALVVAAVALVFFILPAERGIDVTGSGEASGLTNLAEAGEMTELERGALREGVLTVSDRVMHTDRWERELAPYEAVEFKYTMEQGQPLIFTWRATAPVNYDMHSHPFEGGEELTESYGVGEAQSMQGLYVAPFTGIHGWYWQNRTMDNVTVTLETTGGFTHSTIFEGGAPQERPIEGETTAPTRLPEGHQMQNPEDG
jgi:hypothetical protein